MEIIVTNDDGFEAKGIKSLVNILRPFGNLTVVAPKNPQSGMSMAVSMGYAPLAVKQISSAPGESWWYLDGTPASCVKYANDNILFPRRADLVVSGINHGSNAATAAIYSGTVGAAMEGAVNGIPSIAVSLDSFDKDADFSAVETLLPDLLRKLVANFSPRFGSFYNVNFPALPASAIKGVRVGTMGMVHWEREYIQYGEEFLRSRNHTPSERDLWYLDRVESGEDLVVMAGDMTDNAVNPDNADHHSLAQGWVTVTPCNIDNTDTSELQRLCDII